MLEAPHRSGSAETGLHFIQNQKRLMPITPLAQGSHVLVRSERAAGALVGLHQNGRDISRVDTLLLERALKIVERRIGGAEAIRKRRLHETWIQVADPFL